MSYEDQNSLNDLDVAEPLDGASPQELLLAFRQLKAVVKNALLTSHHPDGRIRDTAVSVVPTNGVGSEHIKLDAVVADKLAADSVTEVKILNSAVTADKIADGAVVEDKYGAESIPAAAYKPNSIPLSALGDFITKDIISAHASDDTLRAVTETAIANDAVTDRAVKSVGVGKIVGGNDDDTLLRVGGVWTAVPQPDMDSSVRFAVIGDVRSKGTGGGESTLSTWNVRALGDISDPSDLISFTANKFTLVPGNYFVFITVPGRGVSKHQSRLVKLSADGSTVEQTLIWGTSTEAPTGSSSNSLIIGMFTVVDGDTLHAVQHYTTLVTGASDYGIATNATVTPVDETQVEVYTIGFIAKYD